MANLLLFANVDVVALVAAAAAVAVAVADVFSSPTVVVVAKLVGTNHFKTFDIRSEKHDFSTRQSVIYSALKISFSMVRSLESTSF